ncbi:hypothetical protein DHEL01_v209122 [Diaporthe helianthi]|uniref:Uncharacterized protein n=1 Tax=Diaporthe helianthi TaxID=158607 RepID=A0A2P5HQE2_DIAHE|nr:hypothetical protein DHEL01_v209122 [Diaporthe helianthi]
MHRPFAQRPVCPNPRRIYQICTSSTALTPSSLGSQLAKAPFATLGACPRRVRPLQGMPNAGLLPKPILPTSRPYRFGPPKPSKHSLPDEAQTGPYRAKASSQQGSVGIQDVVIAIEHTVDQLLPPGRIPPEDDEVVAALRKCAKAASLIHAGPASPLRLGESAESDTAASSLLSMDGPGSELTQSVDTTAALPHPRPSDLSDRISEAAFVIVSHPDVAITSQVLEVYLDTQARLGKVETLPHALGLYASKPKPRRSRGPLQYLEQNPDRAANAVDPDLVDKALNAAIEAKNLDAAIGIIENSYATKPFIRAKLLKKALLPASAVVATPIAVYLLASNLAHLQSSFDQKTATAVATAGILAYVGFTGWMGALSAITQNDHMKRVTWAPGIPLRERWVHEEERAALDKVACSFGFSQAHRFGEEEGADFQALREFLLCKGMVLDRVELMEGMS